MPVTVLYFAVAREAAGRESESLAAWPATVGDLRGMLATRHPALARVLPRCRLAVNQEFAQDGDPVPDGAEVAVIPPVSGGAGRFRVVDRPLDLAEVVDAVAGPERAASSPSAATSAARATGSAWSGSSTRPTSPWPSASSRRLDRRIGGEHGAEVSIVHRVGALLPARRRW